MRLSLSVPFEREPKVRRHSEYITGKYSAHSLEHSSFTRSTLDAPCIGEKIIAWNAESSTIDGG